MLFVALGTHWQPMSRLIGPLAAIARDQPDRGPFWMQHGPTPLPPGWGGEPLVGGARMAELIGAAEIVVSHAGPATIAETRAAGKIPIVIPRRSALSEHVSDHQLPYAERLAAAREVLLVADSDRLGEVVRDYEELIAPLPAPFPHDPAAAIERFSAIADELLGDS
jgi:UDP-N-acetylglucosamine transferase subunit ALG13